MGRRHHRGGTPQRTRLIADSNERIKRADLAFSLFRPTTFDDSQSIYSRIRPLQQEEDIPENIALYTGDHHASLIQQKRMRKPLVMVVASGFAVSSALREIEHELPGMGREWVQASITGVELVGRNRNTLIARIADSEGVLRKSRHVVKQTLGNMGLKLDMDHADHITLGERKTAIPYPEARNIKEVVGEALIGMEVELKPVVLEYDGQRLALSEASSRIAA